MKDGDMVTERTGTLMPTALGIIIESRVSFFATSQAQADHMVYWSAPTSVEKNPLWVMARDLKKTI